MKIVFSIQCSLSSVEKAKCRVSGEWSEKAKNFTICLPFLNRFPVLVFSEYAHRKHTVEAEAEQEAEQDSLSPTLVPCWTRKPVSPCVNISDFADFTRKPLALVGDC